MQSLDLAWWWFVVVGNDFGGILLDENDGFHEIAHDGNG